MKKQFDIKKLVLLNLPYLLMGLFATNFGEGRGRFLGQSRDLAVLRADWVYPL